MSKLVSRAAVDTIDFPDGERCFVRQRLDAEESACLRKSLAHFTFNVATGKVEQGEMEWHLDRLRTVEAYLVGWDFKDDDGQPIPFDRAVIGRLDPEVVDAIYVGINKFANERAEVQGKKGAQPSN